MVVFLFLSHSRKKGKIYYGKKDNYSGTLSLEYGDLVMKKIMNRKTIAIVCLIFVIVLFSALQGQILLGIIMALLTPIIIGLLQFEEKISQVIDKYLEND